MELNLKNENLCKIDDTSQPTDCSICYSNINNPCILNCKHVFHKFCIKKWYDKNSTCPLCRQPINKQEINIKIDKILKFIIYVF